MAPPPRQRPGSWRSGQTDGGAGEGTCHVQKGDLGVNVRRGLSCNRNKNETASWATSEPARLRERNYDGKVKRVLLI